MAVTGQRIELCPQIQTVPFRLANDAVWTGGRRLQVITRLWLGGFSGVLTHLKSALRNLAAPLRMLT